ncbi:hypothetical protein LSH36_78g05025 [Paralvinella palmiformis]|uniref:BRCT domain-containing protein n=1 Tax=Paralvinella palmiformis TaxID=53620 RepID=A0AAD9K408_9ANNE|nr:hypothetical protein LSH36_78g05025 [Paralvinella palmiformis]
MPEIKLQHVISCSSEDSTYPADNLITGDGFKKWKCAKAGEKQISITFQLEKASRIEQIDIGNDGSAFVEVLVGKSSVSKDDFQVILVASSFMSPMDSRAGKNMTAVRMFSSDKLSKNVLDQKWDRVKVVCTQPFSKSIQYGLAFIKLHSPSEEGSTNTQEPATKQSKLGGFKLKPEEGDTIRPGSLFSTRDKERVAPSPLTGAAAVRAASKLAEESHRSASKENRQTKSPKDGAQSMKRKLDESSTKHGTSESRSTPTASLHKHHSYTESSSFIVLILLSALPTKIEKNVVFDKLMKKVVFVMSGYQNPERGRIRDKALEMGATYKADWTKECTHLICAFENTPKYNQVKGNGRIVSKKWILDSYKANKLLPWRQYRLGRARSPPGGSTDGDSDDEVKLKETHRMSTETFRQKPKPEKSPMKKPEQITPNTQPSTSKQADDSIYDASTDEDVPADTRNGVDVKTSDSELLELPDLFRGKKFFFYGNFKSSECRKMRRFIIAYNGRSADWPASTWDTFVDTPNLPNDCISPHSSSRCSLAEVRSATVLLRILKQSSRSIQFRNAIELRH